MTDFNLNTPIDLGVLAVSLDLIDAWVDQIRQGDMTTTDDIRRKIASNRPYSVEEQLDELSVTLAAALQVLAFQTTWKPR